MSTICSPAAWASARCIAGSRWAGPAPPGCGPMSEFHQLGHRRTARGAARSSVPPGRNKPGVSLHHTAIGCRLVTRSNASSANGNGARPVTTTTTPRGCNRRVASAALGGQDSVAAIVGGNLCAPSSTSPPPVWMSRAAEAWAQTRAHQPLVAPGRALLGGPAVQPGKSQPSTFAATASAIRSSNDASHPGLAGIWLAGLDEDPRGVRDEGAVGSMRS